MQILESYEFKRASRSQYAPAVAALLEDGAFAVKLKRGEDFPEEAAMQTVQGAISAQVRNASDGTARARTWAESDDALIVSLYTDGEGPKPRRKRKATA